MTQTEFTVPEGKEAEVQVGGGMVVDPPKEWAPADREEQRRQNAARIFHEIQAKRKAILDHKSPVEKYVLEFPRYPETWILARNGAGKVVAKIPNTPSVRRQFHGRTKVTVKAKLIDNTLTILRWVLD